MAAHHVPVASDFEEHGCAVLFSHLEPAGVSPPCTGSQDFSHDFGGILRTLVQHECLPVGVVAAILCSVRLCWSAGQQVQIEKSGGCIQYVDNKNEVREVGCIIVVQGSKCLLLGELVLESLGLWWASRRPFGKTY